MDVPRRQLVPWLASAVIIVAITTAVGFLAGASAAWGLGALLVALWAAVPAILGHLSATAENPPPAQVKPVTASESATQVEVVREQRRPHYTNAKEALGRLSADFDEVRSWVANYAEHGHTDSYSYIVGRGHPTHTPMLRPLVDRTDTSLGEAFTALDTLEWAGIIPQQVLLEVGRFVRLTDGLLRTVKGGYVVKPERWQKWMTDAEDLQFVVYHSAIKAMKDDLGDPADR